VARSVRLTARHLGLTMLTVGPLLVVETVVHHWVLDVREQVGPLAEAAISVPSIVTIGALIGLVEVELAYALLARDPGSSTAAMVAATAGFTRSG
jgi:hypothetical protein